MNHTTDIPPPQIPDTAPVDENALEDALSLPTPALVADFAHLDGDILVLGAGGKMGPTLARMARRALDAAGRKSQRVIAVARFTSPLSRQGLEDAGVETVIADLSDRKQVSTLPEAANVIYMAGQKFGTSGTPEVTWMMNAHVPALVAEKYAALGARSVVFSTGCVYPNVAVSSGGSCEEDDLTPLGEYANSCVARERLYSYFCNQHGAPAVLFRLNYAIDLRYGVLVDVARKVAGGEPVDLTMGYANVLWQGDANAYALRSLLHTTAPPLPLNVTGPETFSIREAATQLGELLGRTPVLTGHEADTALLSDATRAHSLMGPPTVPLATLIRWVADWQRQGGRLLNKPTHYETRDGKY